MPALQADTQAPEVSLSSIDGKPFTLSSARAKGPVVLAFFKISCPVCQFALPYLQRIFKAHESSGKMTIVGISQDSAADTQAFTKKYGITFPVLLDELRRYPASNAYRLTNVPSIFMVSPDGRIELSSVGWSRAEMQQLNERLAQADGAAPALLFSPGEQVPEYKPG